MSQQIKIILSLVASIALNIILVWVIMFGGKTEPIKDPTVDKLKIENDSLNKELIISDSLHNKKVEELNIKADSLLSKINRNNNENEKDNIKAREFTDQAPLVDSVRTILDF